MPDRLRWDTDGARWPHRAHSRFVDVAGQRWHVQVLGAARAPVLWLLHGTGAASHSWRDLVPLLAPHFMLVVPDLPGHGFSARLPRARQSLPGMAAALGGLAQTLALPPDLVVGHSAGAALAVRAVLDGRLAPQRLVGLNAALLPFGGVAGRVFGPIARLMAGGPLVPRLFALSARDASAVRRMVAATGSELGDEGLALYAQLMRSPGHVAGVLAMMADWDLAGLWRQLPALRVPLTLLVASRDLTVPPAQARRTQQRLPGTPVLMLDGLGHLAHEEAPAVVVERLREVLAPPLAVPA
jgi:magnesium chelatase accessory protein